MPKLQPDIPPCPEGLAAALDALVFAEWDQEFLKTDAGKRGRSEVVTGRFEAALRFTVPWLSERIDLASSRIVEIGCGSGSSTAAMALHAKSVHGFDIDEKSVRAAEARCRAYGLSNVKVNAVPAEGMLASVVSQAKEADVFLLYAVLEHLTPSERLETLSTLWQALPPGGHLVIVETPNRLTWVDRHTSELEFYHLLPDEIAFRYLDRVPRFAFRDSMRGPLAEGREAASLARIRWGLGASYHELLVSIDEPLEDIVVADGLEREMTDFFPVELDERHLVRFFLDQPVRQPMGFARGVLNLILRKPRSDADREEARRFNTARRAAMAAPTVAAEPPNRPIPPSAFRMPAQSRVSVKETFGLDPIPVRAREAVLALRGDASVPPSKFDTTSLRVLKPWLSVKTWAGVRRRDRKIPIYNFFNRTPTPIAAGWSVRKTQVRDWRGGDLTYDSHNGTDFAIPVGTVVVAAAPGRVLRVSSEFNRGGLKVFIDHGDGLITTSNHLSRSLVSVGDVVRRGEAIALSGYSGLDGFLAFPWSVPHVHFNVWLNGEYVDPFAVGGELPLWREGNDPKPPVGIEHDTFVPTPFEAALVDDAIAHCTDLRVREELRGEPDVGIRAMNLLFHRNYYPTRFDHAAGIPALHAATFARAPRLSLPFTAADFDGIAY